MIRKRWASRAASKGDERKCKRHVPTHVTGGNKVAISPKAHIEPVIMLKNLTVGRQVTIISDSQSRKLRDQPQHSLHVAGNKVAIRPTAHIELVITLKNLTVRRQVIDFQIPNQE